MTSASTHRCLVAVIAGCLAWAPCAQAQYAPLLQLLTPQPAPTQPPSAQPMDEGPPEFKRWREQPAYSRAAFDAAQGWARLAPDPALAPWLTRLHIEGERGAVLNLQRVGLVAMALGQTQLAQAAFDLAIGRIDRFHVNEEGANKAKSLWSAESVKDFKGEPYERVMTFYYRGLLYAAAGDFENARASFKRADLEDAMAGAEPDAGDFALMPLLAAWVSECEGSTAMAREFSAQARRYDPALQNLAVRKAALVLFEQGRAPFKYAAGARGEKLKFAAQDADLGAPVAAVCPAQGPCVDAAFMKVGDVAFQATTRGGRAFDAILDGKASFADSAGSVANVSGGVAEAGLRIAAQTGRRDMLNLGALGAVVSLVSKGVESATQAHTDIREWGQLPASVWLQYVPPPVAVAATVRGRDGTRYRLAPLRSDKTCALYWGTAANPLTLREDIAGPLIEGTQPRDAAFRAELAELLPTQGTRPQAAYAALFEASAPTSSASVAAVTGQEAAARPTAARRPPPPPAPPPARADKPLDVPPLF